MFGVDWRYCYFGKELLLGVLFWPMIKRAECLVALGTHLLGFENRFYSLFSVRLSELYS
jgi:hypothetical protein